MLLLIVAAISLAAIVSWAYLLSDCKRLKIPGPFPLPVLGNALMLVGDASHFFTTLVGLNEKYGDVARVYLLLSRYMLLAHPKYIKFKERCGNGQAHCLLQLANPECYIGDFSSLANIHVLDFISRKETSSIALSIRGLEPLCSSTEFMTKGRSYDCLMPWLGEGLLTSTVFCKTEKVLLKKLSNLANGQPFDLFPIIALAALDNAAESVMGVPINAQEDNYSEYVKAIEEITIIASARMRNPFIWNDFCFNIFYKQRHEKALVVLHGQSNKVIAARREELERNGITSLSPISELGTKNKHAFLDLLLLYKIEGKNIDDLAIREEVDTFLFESHDTVTSGLVFSLYCISNHEDVQNKIIQEQKLILGEDLNRDITFSDLQKMQYLEQVIKESMRLYPPIPFIERYMTRDSKVGELFIPKDTSVIINIFHMQRHPGVHDDPLTFRPERIESGGNTPFNWMFFSAGPRNCIGQKFAMMEMKVTLAAIIRNFKLVPSYKEPILCADVILRSKNGVHVGFIPRN